MNFLIIIGMTLAAPIVNAQTTKLGTKYEHECTATLGGKYYWWNLVDKGRIEYCQLGGSVSLKEISNSLSKVCGDPNGISVSSGLDENEKGQFSIDCQTVY